MRISFVTTVLNEEKTVESFLDSLFKQTKIPDEIILVDGGSNDNTVANIKNQKYKSKIKIFKEQNLNIAQGRNYGIKKASGDIIAMSDAGCVLHKDWLEKITKPFAKDKADIVAGFYNMKCFTPLQRALSLYLGIPPEKFDQNKFLPSARSIAFKKSLWKKIRGFDEKLEKAGEDTLFNYQAIKHGAKLVRVKDAYVDWEIPNNLWEGLKKLFIYAKGDVEAGIWWHPIQRSSTHSLRIFSVYLRYLTGFGLFLLSFQYEIIGPLLIVIILLYLTLSVWKVRDVVADFRTRLWLPVIQIGSDIAVLFGATWGILTFLKKTSGMV